jgi:hypothetical protein
MPIAVLLCFAVLVIPFSKGRTSGPSLVAPGVPPSATFRRLLDYETNGLEIRTSSGMNVKRNLCDDAGDSIARTVGTADTIIRTTGIAAVIQDGNGCRCFKVEEAATADLGQGDVVLIAETQVIPADGEVVEGLALIDESAVTGDSSPVVRMANRDRSSVLRGTRVLSGRILVIITGTMGTVGAPTCRGVVPGEPLEWRFYQQPCSSHAGFLRVLAFARITSLGPQLCGQLRTTRERTEPFYFSCRR